MKFRLQWFKPSLIPNFLCLLTLIIQRQKKIILTWISFWPATSILSGVTDCLMSFNCALILTLTCKISSQPYDLESGPSTINRKNRMVPQMRKKTNINGTNTNFLSAFWACTTVLWVKTLLLWWSWREKLGLLMCLIHYVPNVIDFFSSSYTLLFIWSSCEHKVIHCADSTAARSSCRVQVQWKLSRFFKLSGKTKIGFKNQVMLEKSGMKMQCIT